MRRHYLRLLALLAVACAPEQPEAGEATAEDTLPAPPFSLETLPPDSIAPVHRAAALPPRPATRRDTIEIEGMAQPAQLTLVRSPDGFTPPFSTYVPQDMQTGFMPGDSTPSVRFVAAFAGQANPDAYLQLRLYPPAAAELVVRQAVDAYVRSRAPREDNVRESERWPWVVDAYDFAYGGEGGTPRFVGTMAIARHGNRYLHVLAHYPAEYAEGMGPRIERILREWRWEDDGAMLSTGR